MENPFTFMHTATVFIVVVCWLFFGFAFLFRENAAAIPSPQFDPLGIGGLLLQMLAIALVVGIRRPQEVTDTPLSLQIGVSILTIALGFGSTWMVLSAVRTLARRALTHPEGEYRLVTEGPFCMVRHPIYAGMLGLLVATGLAMSYVNVLVLAVAVYLLGFFLRMRSEERQLREVFGEKFIRYANQVPAIFPKFSSFQR